MTPTHTDAPTTPQDPSSLPNKLTDAAGYPVVLQQHAGPLIQLGSHHGGGDVFAVKAHDSDATPAYSPEVAIVTMGRPQRSVRRQEENPRGTMWGSRATSVVDLLST